MNAYLFSTKAEPYLSAEWTGTRRPWGPAPVGPYVTISREAGSGGASLARSLARKFNAEDSHSDGWRVYDHNLTPRMLKANHLPARLARFLPEDRLPEINSYIGELVGLHPNLWELVQKTNETMRQLANTGNVILVGRGANFATQGAGRGVNVRLVAPVEHRAEYLARLYNISERAALAHNAKCDAARRRYVRTYFNADIDDPTAYDLVINTAKVPLAEAAELVANYVRTRTPAAA